MPSSKVSRRDFSRHIGRSLAFALASARVGSLENSQRPQPAPENAIHLNYNESPYGPSPKAMEALSSCGSIAPRYPDAAHQKMTEQIAQFHGVGADAILLGCGSTEILQIADYVFLAPGKNIVAAEPTFEAVLEYAGVTRSPAIKIPSTSDHRHDLPRMAAACTSKTGIVYVCNPNNPTGTIVTKSELEAFISQVPKTTLILLDEAYFHFADDPRYASASQWIPAYPNLLVSRTFSKIYGLAGMRLGYAVGSKETIARMRKEALQINANAAVLAAARASFSDQDYIAECRTKVLASRNWLCEELAKDGRTFVPSQANFVMIEMGQDIRPIIDQFLARKILVGRQFPAMPTFLRVSIGTQDEMESFMAALREIAPAHSGKTA